MLSAAQRRGDAAEEALAEERRRNEVCRNIDALTLFCHHLPVPTQDRNFVSGRTGMSHIECEVRIVFALGMFYGVVCGCRGGVGLHRTLNVHRAPPQTLGQSFIRTMCVGVCVLKWCVSLPALIGEPKADSSWRGTLH
eukprot:1581349-Amphidinium_carterae.1